MDSCWFLRREYVRSIEPARVSASIADQSARGTRVRVQPRSRRGGNVRTSRRARTAAEPQLRAAATGPASCDSRRRGAVRGSVDGLRTRMSRPQLANLVLDRARKERDGCSEDPEPCARRGASQQASGAGPRRAVRWDGARR